MSASFGTPILNGMQLLSFIEIETFTGLPAHPFLNRIAMYVVPTSLALSLAALVRPRWRRRLAPWVFGTAVLALVSVQITMGAGEVMDNVIHRDANPLVEEHEDWSKLLRIALLGHVVATGLLWWSERRAARRGYGDGSGGASTRGLSPLRTAALGLVAVALAVNGYLTVMTAHSGSKSVYEEDGELLTGTAFPTPGDALSHPGRPGSMA